MKNKEKPPHYFFAQKVQRKTTQFMWDSGCQVSKPLVKKISKYIIGEIMKELDTIYLSDEKAKEINILIERILFLRESKHFIDKI